MPACPRYKKVPGAGSHVNTFVPGSMGNLGEPVGSKLQPPGSRLELLGSRLELLGSIVKLTSVKFSKLNLSQNSRMIIGVGF